MQSKAIFPVISLDTSSKRTHATKSCRQLFFRSGIFLFVIVQATAAWGINFNLTLASLTNHNTSAFPAYNQANFPANFGTTSWVATNGTTIPVDPTKMDESLNPVTPGHVSQTDVHTLIPSRPDLRWFAHATPWFGTGSHINIGLTNDSDAYVAAMVTDMKNRGFNGVVIDWYGKGHITDNVTKRLKTYLGGLTNNTFTYIVMVDKGVTGGLSLTNLTNQIHYCQTNYFTDTNYEREPVSTGEPILMFFGVAGVVGNSGMTTIKSETGGNMVWVEQGTSFLGSAWEDECFEWADPFINGINPADPFNLNSVTSQYTTIKNSGKKAFGAMCSQFNGTLTKSIGWSLGKYLPGSNGLCLVQRAAKINTNIFPNMTRMQWVTWSDWEEGTQVEAGIENSVGLSAQVDGLGNLSWTVTNGESRAIDHYEIYASTNGATAALLASAPATISQTNISLMGLPSGTNQLYVGAIGIACVRDHLSSPVPFVVAAPPTTLNPTDYSRSMKITFAGYNRLTAVSNFPVLIELSTSLSGFDYSQFMSPSGFDLRFTDPSGTILSHEIDQWNTNGVSYVWVNVPNIASSTDYIMAYWGNRADTNAPITSLNGAAWVNYSAAFHLKESGFPYADSTTLHSATTGAVPVATTSGEIGNGETFNGTTQYLVPAGAVNLGNSFSLSAWVNLDATATNIQAIWANKPAGSTSNGVALFVNSFNSADGKVLLETGNGVNNLTAASTAGAVPANGWHHVFAVADRTAGTATFYVDGVNVTSSSGIRTDFGNNSGFALGRYTTGSWNYKGTLDEARIEPLRSADWVWTTWMNVVSNSVLENYGPVVLTKVLDQDAFTSALKLIISGYTKPSALSNFPLLVNLSTSISGFSYSQFASPVGNDLRFTDASGQILCNYQIDTWNTNGTSSVWVQVPSLSSSTNYIIAYWGNPALTNAATFTTNGATWSNYFAVLHLKESGFPYADSTTLHSATTGSIPAVTAAGEIGNAEIFNGTTQYLVPAGPVNLGSSFSLSAWVKLDATATNIQTVWANKAAGSTSNGVALFVNSFNTADGKVLLETGNGVNNLTASSTAGAVPVGGWHHVLAAADRTAGTATFYVDGVDVTGTSGIRTDFGNNSGFTLGRYTTGSWNYKGTLDEARIEPLRSADWAWATWMNVASNSAFVSYPGVFVPTSVVGPPPQPPQLVVSMGANGLIFNWTDQGATFKLYSTSNLMPPIQWTPVTNYTVLPGGQVEVPVPAKSGVALYYRLQSR